MPPKREDGVGSTIVSLYFEGIQRGFAEASVAKKIRAWIDTADVNIYT
jgi:hypothetical protein